MRRPSGVTMRSMAPSTAMLLVKATLVRSRRPARSIQISSKRLTITSVTLSSLSSTSSGPRPMASSSSCWLRSARSSSAGRSRVSRMISAISARMLERSSSSFMFAVSTRRLSSCCSSVRCRVRRHCSSGSSCSAGTASRERVSSASWPSARGARIALSSDTTSVWPPMMISSPPLNGP